LVTLKKARLGVADADLLAGLHGLEIPGQGADIGVEADLDLAVQHLGRLGHGLAHRAVEAGGLAEQLVQRHRGVGRPDHAEERQAADRRDLRWPRPFGRV
jgi:hypothetical protein